MTNSDRNIALVVLDTMRKDAFDRLFEWLENISYDNAWSMMHSRLLPTDRSSGPLCERDRRPWEKA